MIQGSSSKYWFSWLYLSELVSKKQFTMGRKSKNPESKGEECQEFGDLAPGLQGEK